MLRELSGRDWQAMLEIPDERVPDAVILRGTRNLKHYYAQYEERFEDVMHVGSPNGIIDDLLIGRFQGAHVAYASVYGSPMASELAHLFASMGTRLILQTGCCGAWADGIRAGDIFVADRAHFGEGASRYYLPDKTESAATVNITPWVEDGLDETLSTHRGGIYTTAALFAESRAEIDEWHQDGWDAVDMETATTFAVAEHFGVPVASLLFVFDNPKADGDIVQSDEEKDRQRQRGNAAMIEATFRVVSRHLGV